jgi:hypothetical protein
MVDVVLPFARQCSPLFVYVAPLFTFTRQASAIEICQVLRASAAMSQNTSPMGNLLF